MPVVANGYATIEIIIQELRAGRISKANAWFWTNAVFISDVFDMSTTSRTKTIVAVSFFVPFFIIFLFFLSIGFFLFLSFFVFFIGCIYLFLKLSQLGKK